MTTTFRQSSLVVLALFLAYLQPLMAQAGDLDALRAYSLELVNASRQEHGLKPLEREPTLDEAAQAHARDMLDRNYFSHVTPDGADVMDRYLAAGGSRWRLVTENLGRCIGCDAPASEADMDRQHRGWMESPEHRDNILSPGLSRYGFGYAVGDGVLVAVQNFSGPGRPRGLAEGEKAQALPDGELARIAVDLVNEARESRGHAGLSVDEDLVAAADDLVADPAEFTLDGGIDPLSALPRDRRGDWARVNVLAGSCGGCGTEPTDADMRFFVERWLDQQSPALLDPRMTHLGIVVRADGEGRKVALAVIAGG
jgi:uncharacterized protein YkwD